MHGVVQLQLAQQDPPEPRRKSGIHPREEVAEGPQLVEVSRRERQERRRKSLQITSTK